jgi:tyrosine-protein kinase
MVWFHGKRSRDQAYRLLIEAGKQDGLFLVRESASAPGTFVLSLWNADTAYHYQIRHHGHCRFSIDEGPVFSGLDTLVNYYRDQAGGLATKLVRCCVGCPPPPAICQKPTISVELGRHLHRACEAGDATEVHRALQDPNINIEYMNDEEGATALHLACKKGHVGIVRMLLEYKANVNSRDKEGRTPLMVGISFYIFLSFKN